MQQLNKTDAIILCCLFLLALGIWAIPSLVSPFLFGESDSYWHYGIGKDIVDSDHIDEKLPYSYITRYFLWAGLEPSTRPYPPYTHINYANFIYLGQDNYIPVGIFKAVSSFIVFAVIYLFCRQLFSQIVALIASFGVILSSRLFSSFLFGQQPTNISFIFVPLAVYLFYRIYDSVVSQKGSIHYIILFFLTIMAQYILHIQGSVISFIMIACLSVILFIKLMLEKKAALCKSLFVRKNLYVYAMLLVVSVAFLVPFHEGYFAKYEESTNQKSDISRLFSWTLTPESVNGMYPAEFVSFSKEYSVWMIPFFLIGIIVCLLRYKEDRYTFCLGLLIGTYILNHLDILIGLDLGRVARMLVFEPFVVWIFIAIGISFVILSIKNLLKQFLGDYQTHAKYVLVIFFLVLIFMQLGLPLITFAKNSSPAFIRNNEYQLAAANWISENLSPKAFVFQRYDNLNWRNYRYHIYISDGHHPSLYSSNISMTIAEWNQKFTEANQKFNSDLPMIYETYLIYDYSDYANMLQYNPNYNQFIQMLGADESYNFNTSTPVYDSRYVKIYNITGRVIY